MLKKRNFLQPIAFTLTCIFFVQSSSLANALTTTSSPHGAQIIPSNIGEASLGLVEDMHQGKNEKIIYIIQDAHTNPSAQFNAASIISEIIDKESVELVLTEADSGNVSLSGLQSFFSKEALKTVSNNYVRKGLLKAPEYLSLNSDRDFVLWGIENPDLYEKSLKSYQKVLQQRKEARLFLNRLLRSIRDLQESIYNNQIKELNKLRQEYIQKQLSDIVYLRKLWQKALINNLRVESLKNLKSLLATQDLEDKLDFDAITLEINEVSHFLEDSKDGGVSHDPINQPMVDYAGKFNHDSIMEIRNFKSKLLSVLPSDQLVKNYPNLSEYFRYTHQLSSLKPSEIILELDFLEETVFENLAVDEQEKKLLAYERRVEALLSMLDLRMTPAAYSKYRSSKGLYDINRIAGYINYLIIHDQKHYGSAIAANHVYGDVLSEAERFYYLTKRRDDYYFSSIQNLMDSTNETKAILFVGGFHASNLKDLFKKNDMSYVSIIPHVYHETDHNRYEEILLGSDGLKSAKSYTQDHSYSFTTMQARGVVQASRLAIIRDLIDADRLEMSFDSVVKSFMDDLKNDSDINGSRMSVFDNFFERYKFRRRNIVLGAAVGGALLMSIEELLAETSLTNTAQRKLTAAYQLIDRNQGADNIIKGLTRMEAEFKADTTLLQVLEGEQPVVLDRFIERVTMLIDMPNDKVNEAILSITANVFREKTIRESEDGKNGHVHRLVDLIETNAGKPDILTFVLKVLPHLALDYQNDKHDPLFMAVLRIYVRVKVDSKKEGDVGSKIRVAISNALVAVGEQTALFVIVKLFERNESALTNDEKSRLYILLKHIAPHFLAKEKFAESKEDNSYVRDLNKRRHLNPIVKRFMDDRVQLLKRVKLPTVDTKRNQIPAENISLGVMILTYEMASPEAVYYGAMSMYSEVDHDIDNHQDEWVGKGFQPTQIATEKTTLLRAYWQNSGRSDAQMRAGMISRIKIAITALQIDPATLTPGSAEFLARQEMQSYLIDILRVKDESYGPLRYPELEVDRLTPENDLMVVLYKQSIKALGEYPSQDAIFLFLNHLIVGVESPHDSMISEVYRIFSAISEEALSRFTFKDGVGFSLRDLHIVLSGSLSKQNPDHLRYYEVLPNLHATRSPIGVKANRGKREGEEALKKIENRMSGVSSGARFAEVFATVDNDSFFNAIREIIHALNLKKGAVLPYSNGEIIGKIVMGEAEIMLQYGGEGMHHEFNLALPDPGNYLDEFPDITSEFFASVSPAELLEIESQLHKAVFTKIKEFNLNLKMVNFDVDVIGFLLSKITDDRVRKKSITNIKKVFEDIESQLGSIQVSSEDEDQGFKSSIPVDGPTVLIGDPKNLELIQEIAEAFLPAELTSENETLIVYGTFLAAYLVANLQIAEDVEKQAIIDILTPLILTLAMQSPNQQIKDRALEVFTAPGIYNSSDDLSLMKKYSSKGRKLDGILSMLIYLQNLTRLETSESA